MRIATWNVEWFAALFDMDGRLLEDDGPSGRYGVTRAEQLLGLGIVFTALDADAIMVVEAPEDGRGWSTVRALEGFAAHYGLRARRAVIGFPSETQQEIALLHDPDVLSVVHDPQGESSGPGGSVDAPRFDGTFRTVLSGEGEEAGRTISFSRPPLELLAQTAKGAVFRMIGVHTKSKVGGNGRDPVRAAIENRRKQLAQCLWIRQRVDEHLLARDPLIVLGDFNDGPELDEYEHLFPLSGVEVVLGWDRSPLFQLYDRHARQGLSKHLAAAPASARFQMHDGRFLSALLDYIMVSPDLRARDPQWRIWHPHDDPVCLANPELRAALLAASDHFPVTLDIDL